MPSPARVERAHDGDSPPPAGTWSRSTYLPASFQFGLACAALPPSRFADGSCLRWLLLAAAVREGRRRPGTRLAPHVRGYRGGWISGAARGRRRIRLTCPFGSGRAAVLNDVLGRAGPGSSIVVHRNVETQLPVAVQDLRGSSPRSTSASARTPTTRTMAGDSRMIRCMPRTTSGSNPCTLIFTTSKLRPANSSSAGDDRHDEVVSVVRRRAGANPGVARVHGRRRHG